jgi:hypothetical protein
MKKVSLTTSCFQLPRIIYVHLREVIDIRLPLYISVLGSPIKNEIFKY